MARIPLIFLETPNGCMSLDASLVSMVTPHAPDPDASIVFLSEGRDFLVLHSVADATQIINAGREN